MRGILDFPARFDADVVLLTRNHRSTPEVLATANAVMAEAVERHPKDLRAERPAAPRARLVTAHDEHAQAVAVADAVLERFDAGVALQRQAVLFRTTHHSEALQVELTVRNIPFVLYGGLRFLETAHVKDLVSTLRLVENPTDELAWFRVLQLIDGIGPALARRITAALVAGDALEAAGERAGCRAAPLAGLHELAASLGTAADPVRHGRPGEQVEVVRGWLDDRITARHRKPIARLADLDRLAEAAARRAQPRAVPHGSGARPARLDR